MGQPSRAGKVFDVITSDQHGSLRSKGLRWIGLRDEDLVDAVPIHVHNFEAPDLAGSFPLEVTLRLPEHAQAP